MAFDKGDIGAVSIFVPKTVSEMLAEVSLSLDFARKMLMLDFYVRSLEDEMGKIDAFKRELPHCMHYLKDAIETLKKEMKQLKEPTELKSHAEGDGGAKPSKDINEKKNWMSCVQLWTTPVQYENNFDTPILPLKSGYEEEEEGSGYGCNLRQRGGAFVPFKKPLVLKEERTVVGVVEDKSLDEVGSIDLNVKDASGVDCTQLQQRQLHRKPRRCWSRELHNHFVDALQQLGGAHKATPKQIRELMNVDGLTNDEVKSHLQKYRLHIRKLPKSNLSWLFEKERGESSKSTMAHSSSPQDHLHKGGSGKGGESMDDDGDDKPSEGPILEPDSDILEFCR